MKKEESKSLFSRREFIRNTSLTAARIYFVPRHVLGSTGYTAPSDKLLIVCIGAGAGGKAGDVLIEFAKSENAEIAFLWM